MIAEVIPATKTTGNSSTFSYQVPQVMLERIRPGQVVQIPLKNRVILGVVRSLSETVPSYPLKEIIAATIQHPNFDIRSIQAFESLSARSASSLGLFIKSALVKIAPKAKDSQIENALPSPSAVVLTSDQAFSRDKITKELNTAKAWLLHGVTGSGKTEVYLDVASSVLKKGGQVLILVPEIALTPQTLDRFTKRFDSKIVRVVHSKVSYGQKYLAWKSIARGNCQVLIGPRSAVFAPFRNLQLIVMDEEHDSSYKQSEQSPRFHARTAVLYLSREWHCPVIFGDATPSIELYHATKTGEVELLRLPTRPTQELPLVQLVDMREEVRAGNFSNFSALLLEKIASVLAKKRQVMLFLNRRGTATGLQCRDCANFVMCERCSVALVYHRVEDQLICHHCSRRYPVPSHCEFCKGVRLRLTGSGTEKIELQIRELFPQARVKRADRDSVKTRSDYEKLYKDFTQDSFDILIGTQILARGWDLHQVELIGVINADTGLAFPDFRSNERTFDLATQVSGRAGRGDFPGSVILQTYSPENPAIQCAVTHQYEKFYDLEIQSRIEYGYPPARLLVELGTKSKTLKTAQDQAQEVANSFKNLPIEGLEVIGPAPAFVSYERGMYRMRVIIKLPSIGMTTSLPALLLHRLSELPIWLEVDVDPDTLI